MCFFETIDSWVCFLIQSDGLCYFIGELRPFMFKITVDKYLLILIASLFLLLFGRIITGSFLSHLLVLGVCLSIVLDMMGSSCPLLTYSSHEIYSFL